MNSPHFYKPVPQTLLARIIGRDPASGIDPILCGYEAFLRKFNIPRKGALHLGGHIGQELPMYAALGFRNVVMVEPLEDEFRKLDQRIAAFNESCRHIADFMSELQPSRACAVRCAVSDRSGTANFYRTRASSLSSLSKPKRENFSQMWQAFDATLPLHKRIMLSHTYQQSSEHDAEAARLDPDNRLYSRAPIRRLEAEAIRDAILFVSGRLDPTMTGPAITHVRNREFLFDHTSKDGTKYDTTRRSVYLPVVRNHLYDFFELFDFPDSATPQGDRPTTTIAPQALLALNSPLIWESAGKMADGIIAGSDEVVLHKLFVTLIGRPPTALETRRNEAWINHVKLGAGDKSAYKRAWQTYIQTLLVSNEFMYVR